LLGPATCLSARPREGGWGGAGGARKADNQTRTWRAPANTAPYPTNAPHIPQPNTELHYWALVVLAVCIVSWFISDIFIGVYDMTVDTIFICFAEDSERNDGSAVRNRKPVAQRELWLQLRWFRLLWTVVAVLSVLTPCPPYCRPNHTTQARTCRSSCRITRRSRCPQPS